MAGPPAQVTATGWLVAVRPGAGGPDDRPTVHRRELQVTAPGAELAAEVVALLALDAEQATDLVDRAVGGGPAGARGADLVVGAPVVDDPPVAVTLSATDHPEVVVVRGPGAESPEQRRPRVMVADGLLSTLTRARLDEDGGAPRLHGAAVTDETGRAIVLLGTSGAGKSTLAAGLAAAGLDLINDEQITVLAAAGRVAGFVRPLSVKPGSLPHLPPDVVPAGAEEGSTRMLLTAAALGSRHRLAGRPALVVVPERSDDHVDPPSWEVVGPADAVRELCTHNLDLVRDPAGALDAFAWLATAAPMVRLRYREAAEAVPVLSGLLVEPPPHRAPDWSVEVEGEPADDASPGSEGAPVPPTVARRAGVVTAWVGDGAVLFEPSRRGVAVLNREGVAVWRSLPWTEGAEEVGSNRDEAGADDAPAGLLPLVVPGFVADLAERRFVALAGRAATVYGRRPGLVSRRVRGTVIVSRPDHQVARLQGAAAAVWDALDGPGRADEVVGRVGGDEEAGADRWEERAVQVEAAVALLVDGGLVRSEPGPVDAGATGDGLGTADESGTSPSTRVASGRTPRPIGGFDPGRVEGVLAQVAGWLLPGAPPVEPLANPDEADLLVDRATTLRLLGPLLVAVDAGALDLRPSLVERVVTRHEESMLWCLHLEVRLLEIRRQLDDAGVPFLLTKGAAVARLDDLDPSLRSFVDLDLLVPGDDIDRAVAVLAGAGARRSYVERRPGFDRRFVKSVTLTYPDDVEIDVHRTLCDGTHGFRIPVDRLHADATSFRIGGEEVRTLSRVHRALHAAYHGVLGSAAPPLRTVRDVAAYIASPDLPPEVLAAEARRWRGEAVLAEALRTVFETFELDAPLWQEWLDEVAIDPREADIVDRQRVESGSFGRAKLTALRELGWSDRVAFATAVALPTSAHLRSRGIRRTEVVRTAAVRARGSARDAVERIRERRR